MTGRFVADGLADARAALARGDNAVIWTTRIADIETPVSAALKLFEPGRGDWLLESVEGGAVRGRYSLIGIDPDLMFRADGHRAMINRTWRSDRAAFAAHPLPTLDALRALVAESRFAVPDALPGVVATLVGHFAFETFGLIEPVGQAAESSIGLPDMCFARPSVIVVFDRLRDTMAIVAPVWATNGTDTDTVIARAEAAIQSALDRLDGSVPRAAANMRVDTAVPDPTPVVPPGTYQARVRRAQEYIAAGDVFQVVLAQRFTAPFALPPMDLYRALRRINPSPFLYFLDEPDGALIGSSPEILVRVRDGQVTVRPIAGTAPRGADDQADEANRAALLANDKERAEHLMLLDLGRNDVGRVARAGTVEVTDSFMVEHYSHVMHIVSNVVGTLAPGHDAIDALFAGFPAGTVSGAPKVRACQIIAELETERRGVYAGGVGYFSPNGDLDSCIVLRTAVVMDGVMHVQAGAGIVAGSDPDAEQRECEAKAGALFAAAREAVAAATARTR